MTLERSHPLLQHLHDLAETARMDGVSDQDLIEAFVATRSEAAFAALLRRHGGMVLALCRRTLRHEQDAEDAFQATFLLLARKASTLRTRGLVAGWLYGVARRTALKARTARARRRVRETDAPVRAPGDSLRELTSEETQAILDEELAKLPDRLRAPLVLCCLEGQSRQEAARQLRWPESLVKSRLEQARECLRRRLSGRGVAPATGLPPLEGWGPAWSARMAPDLTTATGQAAVAVSGGLRSPAVSASVLALYEGMVQAMRWGKLKKVVVGILVVGLVAAGGWGSLIRPRGPGRGELAPGEEARAAPAPRPKANPLAGLKPAAVERWTQAETVCTARLLKYAVPGSGLTDPPLSFVTLTFRIDQSLRGDLRKGETLTASRSVRQDRPPTYPAGKDCVIALKRVRGRWWLTAFEEKSAAVVAQAKQACSIPVGWSLQEGRLVSPWAVLGRKAWPAEATFGAPLVCARTGRPALLAGPGVQFTAEGPTPPGTNLPNPDGNGEYRITVRNTTDRPLSVPALLFDGEKVLWEESLVIRCQGKAYPAPGARGVRKAPRPTVLKPGQAVSTTVNVLRLEGPTWPGGARLEFQFALGERSAWQSFYYYAPHHGPIRKKLLGGK